MGEMLVFWVLASIIGLSSLMVVTSRKPMSCALFLLVTIVGMSGLYAMMGAEFVAAIQILLYAGAILVLFLFVIMMLKLPELPRQPMPASEWMVLVLSVLGFGFVAFQLWIGGGAMPGEVSELVGEAGLPVGNTAMVGMKLFADYLWPFEVVSIVILLAIVAAVVLTRKGMAGEK